MHTCCQAKIHSVRSARFFRAVQGCWGPRRCGSRNCAETAGDFVKRRLPETGRRLRQEVGGAALPGNRAKGYPTLRPFPVYHAPILPMNRLP